MGLVDGDAILLAGGTGRVGGATLATLVREGARVVVISRSRERAAAAIAEHAPNAGDRTIPFAADISDPQQAEAAVRVCVERFGRIDALVSLAGQEPRLGPLVNSTLDDLHANLIAYVDTAYNLSMAALRAMLAQPFRDGATSRGRIVTITAGSSRDPAPRRGLFGTAKAAVNTLMRAIAKEHKADGIVANAVVLGGVQVEASRARRGPEAFAAAATPQEVADTVAFLASARGSGINGELVDLNARETD
jgi:NAD(P)-dependent dehydrogenase (short-subunit alcohol dehydrogenase family)